MALNIKDEETDRLARELARVTGLPITTAVRGAIEAQLATLRRRERFVPGPDLESIIARGRARQTLDTRPESEILGFDEDGLPE